MSDGEGFHVIGQTFTGVYLYETNGALSTKFQEILLEEGA